MRHSARRRERLARQHCPSAMPLAQAQKHCQRGEAQRRTEGVGASDWRCGQKFGIGREQCAGQQSSAVALQQFPHDQEAGNQNGQTACDGKTAHLEQSKAEHFEDAGFGKNEERHFPVRVVFETAVVVAGSFQHRGRH